MKNDEIMRGSNYYALICYSNSVNVVQQENADSGMNVNKRIECEKGWGKIVG